MSDYKMVPVVATQEMLRAAQVAEMDHDDFEDWMYFSGREVAKQYTAMLAKAPPFVVTDEVVEKAAMAVERIVTADGFGWTDEQFNTWWNSDPFFCKKVNTWASFTGTRKQKRIYETRAAIEAVLGGGK